MKRKLIIIISTILLLVFNILFLCFIRTRLSSFATVLGLSSSSASDNNNRNSNIGFYYDNNSTTIVQTILKSLPPQPPLPLNANDPLSCYKANLSHTLSLLRDETSAYHKIHRGIVPRPILNMGFPKTGTTTLHAFFKCMGIDSKHQFGPHHKDHGTCMRNATWNYGLPPIQSCGNYEAYTQLDYDNARESTCFFPQIEFLEEFHKEVPNATFVLLFRNMEHWIHSIERYLKGKLHQSLILCNTTGFPSGVGKTRDELRQWFCDQINRVRRFVQNHPSHMLIEIDIEADTTSTAPSGPIMEALFHMDATKSKKRQIRHTCWGHHNAANRSHVSMHRRKKRKQAQS